MHVIQWHASRVPAFSHSAIVYMTSQHHELCHHTDDVTTLKAEAAINSQRHELCRHTDGVTTLKAETAINSQHRVTWCHLVEGATLAAGW
jgi:hypothetical protein